MKTTVKYLDQKYTIDNINKKVHCVLKFKINLSKSLYPDSIRYLVNLKKIAKKYNAKLDIFGYYITLNVHSVATCSPDDVFNEDLGKKIALTRAQKQAFNITKNIYADITINISKILTNMLTLLNHIEESENKCGNHIIDLIDNN